MVLKTGSWILGGAFFIFQMYIVSNMGSADETSFMLMLVIALIAFLKTWSDYNGEKTNKN
jgi:nitrate/nitrite transporter NarK